MTEDRPWLGEEPTGASQPDFSPGPTGIAVFLAVAAPIVFAGIAIGVRRDGQPSALVIVIGVVVGLVAGALTTLALSRRRD